MSRAAVWALVFAALAGACGRGLSDPPERWHNPDKGQVPEEEPPAPEVEDPVIDCARPFQPVLDGASCSVSEGLDGLLFHAHILGPDGMWKGGELRVDKAGTIVCAGCDCSAGAEGAKRIECPDVVVAAGLINAHDHLTWSSARPVAHSERYDHRTDWRKGGRGDTKLTIPGGLSSNASVQLGELRFVLSGATSTIGAGAGDGFLRNLDRSEMEGLYKPPVLYQTFPLGGSDGPLLASGCDYGSFAGPSPAHSAYFPHVSEGADAEAHNEFSCMSSEKNGGRAFIDGETALIHGIALDARDAFFMSTVGASLVWSARTNIDLYGYTASVTLLDRLGVNIALGTDWLPSGSMNMSRELACVDQLNRTQLGNYFSPKKLYEMASKNGARAAHMDDLIGSLAPGKLADLALFRGASKAYRAVIESEPKDVVLVLRGGTALYGEAVVVQRVTGSDECEPLDVCGVSKRVCVKREAGLSLSELQAVAGHSYPLFVCGAPPSEPSCTPFRNNEDGDGIVFGGAAATDDLDGDGVKDALDSCPDIFNPPRPMDLVGGVLGQADFDGDGQGDVCDPCPLEPDIAECRVANDIDLDGVANVDDNCRSEANPDQMDGDADGKGDLCDRCPEAANPGDTLCPRPNLFLTEVLPNAIGADLGLEWVKLYNQGPESVELTGYVVAFGGSASFSGTGTGRVSLQGTLAPGTCLLVHGGLSSEQNGLPAIDVPPAQFAPPLAVEWPGSGLQNPSTTSPDAVALFGPQDPAVPLDLVVYMQAPAEAPPIVSEYTGSDGQPASVMVSAPDVSEGVSFVRTGASSWMLNPQSMTPNVCTQVENP